MLKQILAVIARLTNALLNGINRKRQKEYTDNVADTLSNGGNVVHSKQTFAELSKQTERNKAE